MKKRIRPIVQIKKSRAQPKDHIAGASKLVEVKELPAMWAEGAKTDHRVKPKISYNDSWRLN